MVEKKNILDEIDLNNDHMLQPEELDTFTDILKNPKRREIFINELENDKQFQSWFYPEVEKFVKEIIQQGRKDKNAIIVLQFYIKEILKSNTDIQMDWMDSSMLQELIQQIWNGMNIENTENKDITPILSKIKDWEFLKKDFVEAYIRHIKYKNDVDLIKIFLDKNDIKTLDEYFGKDEGKYLFSKTLDKLWYENFKSNLGTEELWQEMNKEALTKEFYEDELKWFMVQLECVTQNMESDLNNLLDWIKERGSRRELTWAEWGWYAMEINKINEKFEKDTNFLLEWLAQKYTEFLVDIDSKFINNWEKTKLPIWNFDIILNFGCINDKISWKKDKTEIKNIIKQNIKDIYRDTNWEKLWDSIKKAYTDFMNDPRKWRLDLLAILWWAAVATVVAWTVVIESPLILLFCLWLAYTSTNKLIKWAWYSTVAYQDRWTLESLWEWFLEWAWVEKKKNWEYVDLKTNLINNTIEVATNGMMFWMFQGMNNLWRMVWFEQLDRLFVNNTFNSLKWFWINTTYQWSKVWVEAAWLTEVNNISQSAKTVIHWRREKSYNFSEISDKFDEMYWELSKTDNFLDSMAYNYLMVWFIKSMYNWLPEMTNKALFSKENRLSSDIIFSNQRQIERIISKLKIKGYNVEPVQRNGRWEISREWAPANVQKDLIRLRKIFDNNNYLSTKFVKELGKVDPENWRWWSPFELWINKELFKKALNDKQIYWKFEDNIWNGGKIDKGFLKQRLEEITGEVVNPKDFDYVHRSFEELAAVMNDIKSLETDIREFLKKKEVIKDKIELKADEREIVEKIMETKRIYYKNKGEKFNF